MKTFDFNLPDQTGTLRRLSDWNGKWVVLYFYPKDETSGCTAEACAFRDQNEKILARGAEVVGISKDSPESHAKFIAHHDLPFTLLSDPDSIAIKAYDAYSPLMTKRKTFIISPEGEIVKEYQKVTPAEHATQIIADLDALQAAH